MYRTLVTALSAVFATACGGQRVALDTAEVCLGSSETTAETTDETVAEDEPLQFTATAMAGCHTADLEVTCSVSVDGDTITVHTETTWVKTEPLAMSCEAILFSAQTTCESPPLPAGVWVVRYGDSELTLDVPGPVDGCL